MNQILANQIPSAILEKGIKKTFLKNSNIFNINSNVTKCYLIQYGMVKIYVDHGNGRRSILDFAGCNDWLGELSIFYNEADIKENKVILKFSAWNLVSMNYGNYARRMLQLLFILLHISQVNY